MGTTTAISQQCTTKPPTPLCTTTPGHTPTTRSIGRTPWFTRLQFTNTTPTLSTTNCHQLAYGLISKRDKSVCCSFEFQKYNSLLCFILCLYYYHPHVPYEFWMFESVTRNTRCSSSTEVGSPCLIFTCIRNQALFCAKKPKI